MLQKIESFRELTTLKKKNNIESLLESQDLRLPIALKQSKIKK